MIVRNPAHDVEFQHAIDDILAAGTVDPEVAQQLLRNVYPRATIRRRELESEPTEVWYAYRDGRWVSGD